jgi:hypothetical protein
MRAKSSGDDNRSDIWARGKYMMEGGEEDKLLLNLFNTRLLNKVDDNKRYSDALQILTA